MKIKAVRKNQSYTKQDYLTLGKEYEVERKVSPHYYSITDDAGEEIYAALNNCAHGFDFEVVQEELEQKAPKFKVGDGVMCKITLSDYVGVIDTLVRVLAKDSSDSTHGFDFDVVQEEPEGLCPDPMPVVEPVDDLECDRIEDNLNWLEGLTNGSPDQPTEGGPTEYYDFKPNWVTLNDMNDYKAQHQWGPLSFHMGNISKATYRFGEKGNTSKVYDINKIIYSGLRCKLMLEDKKAVRKYLQQLLDDPQFQENTK